MKRILITGAAGNIGSALRKGLRGSYPLIRLLDVAPLGTPENGEEPCTADIRDAAALETAMAGIDCVVHLAGMPTEAPWEEVLRLNIEGCYNVFEAARRGGVKRIVFASSNHAIGFHRRERFIDTNVVPRPDTRYGVSKVFGEAVGRLYADKYGLSVACLRIGSFLTPDRPIGRAPVAHLDQSSRHGAARAALHRLPGLSLCGHLRRFQQFAQSLGQLQSQVSRLPPEDDSEKFAAEILALGKQENEIAAQFHGGFYTPIEFSGDTAKID